MTDELDQLSDAALSEVFAKEVAGLVRAQYPCCHPGGEGWKRGPDWVFGPDDKLPFATSADAVLPFLEKYAGHICERCFDYAKPHVVRVLPSLKYRETYREEFRGESSTFARSVCIALLRAKRAEKGGRSVNLRLLSDSAQIPPASRIQPVVTPACQPQRKSTSRAPSKLAARSAAWVGAHVRKTTGK